MLILFFFPVHTPFSSVDRVSSGNEGFGGVSSITKLCAQSIQFGGKFCHMLICGYHIVITTRCWILLFKLREDLQVSIKCQL